MTILGFCNVSLRHIIEMTPLMSESESNKAIAKKLKKKFSS